MLQTSIHINANFSYETDSDLKVCYVKGEGSCDNKNALEAFQSVLQNDEITKELNIVVDITSLDFHPSFEELMQLKSLIVSLRRNFKNKAAIVASPSFYTLAQMVSIITQMSNFNMKAFKEYDPAFKWLTSA